MKITDLMESNDSPDVLYHGTASSNLTNIFRRGLQPRLNKWIYGNRSHGGGFRPDPKAGLEPGQKVSDLKDLSTTTRLEQAVEYAKRGNSVGIGVNPGVVLAFKPLATDRILNTMPTGEVVLGNTIAPERLRIVWPEKLIGTEDRWAGRATKNQNFGAEKTAKLKDTNKRLRAAGSNFRIKSLSGTTPRIYLYYTPPAPIHYTSRVQGAPIGSDSWSGPYSRNTNMDTKFNGWLENELANPLQATDTMDIERSWASLAD